MHSSTEVFQRQYFRLQQLWWELHLQREKFGPRGKRFKLASELIRQVEAAKDAIRPVALPGRGDR
jgi:hypothetical protein